MKTAYLIAFIDKKNLKIVKAGVFGEASPTTSLDLVSVVFARANDTTYDRAHHRIVSLSKQYYAWLAPVWVEPVKPPVVVP